MLVESLVKYMQRIEQYILIRLFEFAEITLRPSIKNGKNGFWSTPFSQHKILQLNNIYLFGKWTQIQWNIC